MKTLTQNIKQIPYLLVYGKLLMAAFLVLMAFIKPMQNPFAIVIILCMATLTDISDDCFARKFKCYSVNLRQLTSRINILFWFALTFVLLYNQTLFIKQHAVQIFILFASEVVVQLFGYLKFNTTLALHTYSNRAWAALLTLVSVILVTGGESQIIFNVAFIWGVIVQSSIKL